MKGGGKSNIAMELIQKIYKIEKELRGQDLGHPVFIERHRKHLIPIWQDSHRWEKDSSFYKNDTGRSSLMYTKWI